MRIFHVITLSALGGAQSVVCNLANNQCFENEVFVISGFGGDAWSLLDSSVKVLIIPELKREISFWDIFVLIKLRFFYHKYNPDIIHLHSSKIGALGRLIFPSKKNIYTVHGFDSVRIANPHFLFIENLLKNQASYIVGVSEYDKEHLILEGIRNNVVCIYNGIEDKSRYVVSLFSDIDLKLADIRSHYTNVVMCIARDNKQKKIDLFFEIAYKISNVAFVWIGNEDLYTNIPHNVFLMGKISNASSYLRYADLFILPSNYEGLPVSIIEALSFNKPVIASNVGGVSEILDGNNGFAVENRVEDFVEKIIYILSNAERMDKMRKRAKDTFLEKFTIDKMIDSYYRLYETMYH